MEGYYIGFNKTGNDLIDQILSAVAYAAKGAHKTEAWSHELEYDYGPVPADKTFEWLIQEAANDAAERLAAAGVAPQPEPEYGYEYGVGWYCNGNVYAYRTGSRTRAEIDVARYPEFEGEPQFVVRRTFARSEGKWEPVPNQEGEQS